MPSVISHAAVGIAAGITFVPQDAPNRFWVLSTVCSVIPDADIIAFSLGIPYQHLFGHRGFFHSPFFGLLLSIFIVLIFFRDAGMFSKQRFFYLIFFFLLSASHGVLDAFTSGGLGIALFSPFDKTRYFFPWRPVMVSPIGVTPFFSRWGLAVIKSEVLWIWLPSSLMVITSAVIRVMASRH